MGYRSDVRIITSKKGFDKLKKYVSDSLGVDNHNINLLENPDILSVHKNYVLIGWDDIKWYEYCDFKEVDSILSGLKYISENDYSYQLSRMGENIDDFVEEYVQNENDIILPYPQVVRTFDDNETINVINRMEKNTIKKNEKEVVN